MRCQPATTANSMFEEKHKQKSRRVVYRLWVSILWLRSAEQYFLRVGGMRRLHLQNRRSLRSSTGFLRPRSIRKFFSINLIVLARLFRLHQTVLAKLKRRRLGLGGFGHHARTTTKHANRGWSRRIRGPAKSLALVHSGFWFFRRAGLLWAAWRHRTCLGDVRNGDLILMEF